MGLYRRGGVYWIDYYNGSKRVREAVGSKEEARVTLGKRLEDLRMGRNPELRRVRPKRLWGMVKEVLKRHASLTRHPETFRVRARPVLRHFGRITLQEITSRHIEDYIAARLREGVSKATTNRERQFLSKVYACAARWGQFGGQSPVRNVKAFKESPGRTRFLSADEADRLLQHAPDHLKPVIVTALHTGGRLTEVLRLRWEDLDLERGVLYFDQANTKSGKQREIPIDRELDAVLRECSKVRSITGYVFTWQGRAMERVATSFERARKRADLGEDVSFHTLRHTFASWYMINGGDLYRLQRILGHSTITLTQRYAHLSADYLRAAVQFFGAPKPARELEITGHKSDTVGGRGEKRAPASA